MGKGHAVPLRRRDTPPDPVPRELYTVKETADALHVSYRTVERWISAGELLPVRMGRSVRIRRADIAALIDAHVDDTSRGRQRRKRAAS